MKYLILALLLLSACNPLRPEQLKVSSPPPHYAIEAATTSKQLSQLWWLDFNDPKLNQLQQKLFNNNLNLRQALYRLQQLDALQKISGAALWPQLGLSGSYSRNHAPGLIDDTTTTSKSLSLAASYEVDLWHRLSDKKTAATLRQQAGEKDVQALLLNLSGQLSEQYFLAIEQRAQLQLLQQQAKHSSHVLQTITDRYRAGLSTAGEVYQARQNLAAINARSPQYKTALAQAENGIAILLGQLPGTIEIDTIVLPTLTGDVSFGLPADLLLQRPDVAASLLQLEAADHELAAALAARLPAIQLSATLGKSISNLAAGDIEGTIWSLALGVTQPLIDGGRLRAESERQHAIRAEQLAAYQQTLLTAIQEVESALTAQVNSVELAKQLKLRLQINTDALQLTEDNYRYGLIDSDDLLQGQITQLEILTLQLNNQRQQLSNHITLARALGGNWMAAEINQQQKTLNQDGNK